MIKTSLRKIKIFKPCEDGYKKALAFFCDIDKEISLLDIIESNGIEDALWCLRVWPEHDREWRLFAVWCARQVQHLLTNDQSIHALDIAEKYANGKASQAELSAAWFAAGDAANSAAWSADWDASWSAARASQKEHLIKIVKELEDGE